MCRSLDVCATYRLDCGDYGAGRLSFTGTFELALKAGFALLIIQTRLYHSYCVRGRFAFANFLFKWVMASFSHNIPVGLKGIFAGEDDALSGGANVRYGTYNPPSYALIIPVPPSCKTH